MGEFEVSICLSIVGEYGEGEFPIEIESREGDGQMVPNEDVDPSRIFVSDQESVDPTQIASFDLVVVTGSFSDSDHANTAARIGAACDPDAISVAVLVDEEVQEQVKKRLKSCFCTVVLAETPQFAREFVTDLCLTFRQPMMLYADYSCINSNLEDGGITAVRGESPPVYGCLLPISSWHARMPFRALYPTIWV